MYIIVLGTTRGAYEKKLASFMTNPPAPPPKPKQVEVEEEEETEEEEEEEEFSDSEPEGEYGVICNMIFNQHFLKTQITKDIDIDRV